MEEGPSILQWKVAVALCVVVVVAAILGSVLRSTTSGIVPPGNRIIGSGLAHMKPFVHSSSSAIYCTEIHAGGRLYHADTRGDFPMQPGPCASIIDRNVTVPRH